MNLTRPEQERKEQEKKDLNQKLIKKTFVNEMRKPKRFAIGRFLIEMFCIFVGLLISDALKIESELLDLVVCILLITITVTIGEIIQEKLN